MTTLRELCLKTIAEKNVDFKYGDLPDELDNQVRVYSFWRPEKIDYENKYDAESILNLANAIEFQLSDGEKESIKSLPYQWINVKKNMSALIQRFYKCIETVSSKKHKVALMSSFIYFFYSNSGLLRRYVFETPEFVQAIRKRIIDIVSIESRDRFDDATIKIVDDLFSVSINRLHKEHIWRGIHAEITGGPFDILRDQYWQWVMGELKDGAEIQHWTFERQLWQRRGEEEMTWYYNGKRVFEQGYDLAREFYWVDYTTGEERENLERGDLLFEL